MTPKRPPSHVTAPAAQRLATAARAANLWLVAGSVPELDEKGDLYNTALVFNPGGDLVAWHRKAHLYPPTLEPSVFRAGDRLTTFEDPALGVVGVVIGFDGDFPEVAGTLARRGARLVVAPAPTRSKGRRPGTSSTLRWRWPTASGGSSRTSAVRTRRPRCWAPAGLWPRPGRWWPKRPGRSPGCTHSPELLVQRIDLHLAYQRDGVGTLLEEGRRPELYVDRVASGADADDAVTEDATERRPRRRRPRATVGLYEGLVTTRAIRRYRDEAIPETDLRDMLFAATRAPSGSNRQPFRFVVLTSGPVAQEAKRLIGEGARRFWGTKRDADGYDRGSGAEQDSPKSRVARTMQQYVDNYETVPVVVLACFVPYRRPVPGRRRLGLPGLPEPPAGGPGPRLRGRHDRVALRRGARVARPPPDSRRAS